MKEKSSVYVKIFMAQIKEQTELFNTGSDRPQIPTKIDSEMNDLRWKHFLL